MTTSRQSGEPPRSQVEKLRSNLKAERLSKLNPDTSSFPGGRAFVDDRCANCLKALSVEVRGLFCSAWCQEAAKHVRYIRRVERDGRIQDPEVREAVQTRLRFLVIGGYKSLGRTLSPQIREAVKERANGLCQTCRNPGVDVDHVSGSSGDLDNLQLLCKACHKEKTDKNLVPASLETFECMCLFLEDRVHPETPRLLSDDEVAWSQNWRSLRNARRKRLFNSGGSAT